MDDVINALHTAQTNGQAVALATVISTQGSMPRHAGSKMLIYPDGRIVGTVGGGAMEAQVIAAAQEAIKTGDTTLAHYALNDLADGDPGICGGTAQIFIEPILSAPLLIVIGAGHVGVELAQLGKWLGLRVALTDDRAAYCTPQAAPGLDHYVICKPAEVPHKLNIDARTVIAAVTRGLPIDIQLIPALLDTQAAYIGLIGSRRRWALTAKALAEEKGLSTADLARVHAPIGLEIEAETPKEIAISILAEIIMVQRGGTGQPMQWLDVN